MNTDLQKERAQATFSVEAMTHFLDGGASKTARRRALEALIAADPIFTNTDNLYLHRTERHVRALQKFVHLIRLCRAWGIHGKDGEIVLDDDFPTLLAAVADDFPTSLHWVMFVPNIMSLCDEEQQQRWLPLCRDWKMIGCYAQTELGHGSNVRALETTATFQKESEGGMKGGSWIIHSPTITSAKFWPGTLGRTANHAMVIARLIDGQGIDRGIHNFLVPLRSMEDHSLLKGVETGDIGPKIGYNTMDNGYCRFDQVQIPRRNMAMRFASVDENGHYTKKQVSEATSKIAYITMMQVRAYIVNEAGKHLAQACTIATRYSAVRRQGYSATGEELPILDYKQQQYRLLSMIACSYGFFFTGRRLLHHLQDIQQKLVHHQSVTKQVVADLHASSSALKSFTTMITANGMEDLRKACGGHGFLQSSGLPELVTTYLQNPTVEGDNHMLPQQVLKVLLKVVHTVSEGNVSAYAACDAYDLVPSLQVLVRGEKETCPSWHDLIDNLDVHYHAFRHRAAVLLVRVASYLQEHSDKMEQAWNDALLDMAKASAAYAQFLLLRNFVQGIESSSLGPAETAVLKDLARLFGLYWMEQNLGDWLEDNYFTAEHAQQIRAGVLQLLGRIRPNAVALVDARDISDFRLKSALGRYDGNVYPAIMEAARRDPLNQHEIGPGYEHLKKLIVDGVGKYRGPTSRL
ncbi:acyl-CoA oxidase [Fistulifera solaris]|uniref:Acyl-coenzyme A oxidase n=1 Tax=Fistulifera solaris TaxID=1519565 RepID=A0A1Z5KJH0_FISSO|nr:acyl-CoA oxidase [Fistulifera solaris]|eukprot:GAX26242.1 acyl-CoA oxidase [Fistulifera solaris]